MVQQNETDSGINVTDENQRPRLQVADALSYVDLVKSQYSNQPQIYESFLNIMKNFRLLRIDTRSVMENVFSLFQGNNELIMAFNMFLPHDYEFKIELNEHNMFVPVISVPEYYEETESECE